MPKIGLSKPYIAFYSNNGTTVTYSGVKTIGRFTELQINVDDSDNDFYSDNEISESDNQFTSGTAVVTTDDLSEDTMQDALGMDTEVITGVSGALWNINNDAQERPFLGFGGIVKKKVGGMIYYVAVVLDKIRFRDFSSAFTTQGKTIEWGTSSLTADIYRSDNARHSWRRYSSPFSTEEQAELVLKTFLGYTPPATQT